MELLRTTLFLFFALMSIMEAGQMTWKMPKRNSNLGPRPFPYLHPSRIMESLELRKGARNSQVGCNKVFRSLLTYPWRTFPNLSPVDTRPKVRDYIAKYSTGNSFVFGCEIISPWYNISIPEDQVQPPVTLEERRAAYWRVDCGPDEVPVLYGDGLFIRDDEGIWRPGYMPWHVPREEDPETYYTGKKAECQWRHPDWVKKYQEYLDSDEGDREDRGRKDAQRRLYAVIVDLVERENIARPDTEAKTSPGQTSEEGQPVKKPRTRTITDYPQDQIECLDFDSTMVSMMDSNAGSPPGKPW